MDKGKFEALKASVKRQRPPVDVVETTVLTDSLDRVCRAVVRIAAIETAPQPRRPSHRGENGDQSVIAGIIDMVKREPQAIAELAAQQAGVAPVMESIPELARRVVKQTRESQ